MIRCRSISTSAQAGIVALIVFGLAPALRANTITLGTSGCSLGCTTQPYAMISFVPDVDGKSIDLSVTLGSDSNGPYHFHENSDTNHFALSFDLAGTPDITITDPSGNFTSGALSPGSFDPKPFGAFDYGLHCTGCGSGYNSGVTSLNIVITAAAGSLSTNSFVPNGGGSFFAVDIVDFLNNSGNVSDPNDPAGLTPEPPAAFLAGGVLISLGLVRRRRR